MRCLRAVPPVVIVLVMLVSVVWGIRVLSSDVVPAGVDDTELSCGGIVGALRGEPLYGGDLSYPDDWIAQCRDAAKDEVPRLVAPGLLGAASVLWVGVSWASAVRRSRHDRRDGRSTEVQGVG